MSCDTCATCQQPIEQDAVSFLFCNACNALEMPWRNILRDSDFGELERDYRFKFDLHVWACGIFNRKRAGAEPGDAGQLDLFGVDSAELSFWDDLCDTLQIARYEARQLQRVAA